MDYDDWIERLREAPEHCPGSCDLLRDSYDSLAIGISVRREPARKSRRDAVLALCEAFRTAQLNDVEKEEQEEPLPSPYVLSHCSTIKKLVDATEINIDEEAFDAITADLLDELEEWKDVRCHWLVHSETTRVAIKKYVDATEINIDEGVFDDLQHGFTNTSGDALTWKDAWLLSGQIECHCEVGYAWTGPWEDLDDATAEWVGSNFEWSQRQQDLVHGVVHLAPVNDSDAIFTWRFRCPRCPDREAESFRTIVRACRLPASLWLTSAQVPHILREHGEEQGEEDVRPDELWACLVRPKLYRMMTMPLELVHEVGRNHPASKPDSDSRRRSCRISTRRTCSTSADRLASGASTSSPRPARRRGSRRSTTFRAPVHRALPISASRNTPASFSAGHAWCVSLRRGALALTLHQMCGAGAEKEVYLQYLFRLRACHSCAPTASASSLSPRGVALTPASGSSTTPSRSAGSPCLPCSSRPTASPTSSSTTSPSSSRSPRSLGACPATSGNASTLPIATSS